MEDWRRPYVVAFKTVAWTSFFCGVALLASSIWSLTGLMQDQHYGHGNSQNDNANNAEAQEFRSLKLLINLPKHQGESRSNENRSNESLEIHNNSILGTDYNGTDTDSESHEITWIYYQGAVGFSIVFGLIQLATCMAILTSSRKGASSPLRVKVWKLIHLGLSLGFALCLLISAATTEHLDNDNDTVGMEIFYYALGLDSGAVLVLVIIAHLGLDFFRVK